MQPISLTLDVPVSDSCSNCSCCFPIKRKKKTKQEKQTQEIFNKCNEQIKNDKQLAEKNIGKTPMNSSNSSSF